MATFLLQGFEPLIVNWQSDLGVPYRNKAAKIAGVHAYLRTNCSSRPDDLIVVADGRDMWAQLPPGVLLERYESLTAGQSPKVLLAADKNCWPDQTHCKDIPENPYKERYYSHPTPKGQPAPDLSDPATRAPRFVNSGNVMGNVATLRRLYDAMLVSERDPFGDQTVFARFYRQGNWSIELDHASSVFFNLGYSLEDAAVMPDHYGTTAGSQRFQYGGMIWNAATGTLPVFVHFPGKAKPVLFDWWPKMWWARKMGNDLGGALDDKHVTIAATGKRITWNALCGGQMSQREDYVPDLSKARQREAAGLPPE